MHYIFIFCLFLCIACGNDNTSYDATGVQGEVKVPVIENPSTPIEMMQGSWAVQELGTATGVVPPYWTFNPDGTVTLKMGNNKAQAKWTMSEDGNSITYALKPKEDSV